MEAHAVPADWRIPDDLWDAMQILLPEHKNTHRFGGGRPRTPDRVCMDAIYFVLRTGCQWKALDATKFGPGSTAHDRFQEWVEAGFFERLWAAGLLGYDEMIGIDWSWVSMDGSMTKAPLGGEKDRQEPHRSSQGGRQAKPVGRRQRDSDRLGRGRRQSERHEDGGGNAGEYSRRPPRAQSKRTSRHVHGQGL